MVGVVLGAVFGVGVKLKDVQVKGCAGREGGGGLEKAHKRRNGGNFSSPAVGGLPADTANLTGSSGANNNNTASGKKGKDPAVKAETKEATVPGALGGAAAGTSSLNGAS